MQTLEDILQELGSKKLFLNEVIINEDGLSQPCIYHLQRNVREFTD